MHKRCKLVALVFCLLGKKNRYWQQVYSTFTSMKVRGKVLSFSSHLGSRMLSRTTTRICSILVLQFWENPSIYSYKAVNCRAGKGESIFCWLSSLNQWWWFFFWLRFRVGNARLFNFRLELFAYLKFWVKFQVHWCTRVQWWQIVNEIWYIMRQIVNKFYRWFAFRNNCWFLLCNIWLLRWIKRYIFYCSSF